MFTLRTLVVVAALLAGLDVEASTIQQSFTNDFDTNEIFFFADAPANLSFGGVSFAGATSAWTVTKNTGSTLVMGGPRAAPAKGLFTVALNYVTQPISFQWAEVYFSGTQRTLLGAGTLAWNGGWSATGTFTHLGEVTASGVVPLPPSVFMLLSALGFMPLLRRRAS